MTGALYLGIDGGATRCRARLCDAEGRVLGTGEAGPANPRLDFDGAIAAIRQAAHAALAAAGLPNGTDEALAGLRAGLGLAGVGQTKDRKAFAAWRHPFAAMAFATDAHTALLGAHAGADGAILILGTGSCGLAQIAGREIRMGGWGFMVSDAASGAWIGHQAVRRALDGHDGVRPHTAFTQAVMARFDHNPERVVAWSETARPADYGTFAPLVLEHATDPAARPILAQAVADAATVIEALLAAGAPRLSLLGGMAEPLRPHLPPDLASRLSPPLGNALDGAMVLARRA